jgi:hypothetical protein
LTQFVSRDDEHDVLETCQELKIKTNTYKRIVRQVGHLPKIIPSRRRTFWAIESVIKKWQINKNIQKVL